MNIVGRTSVHLPIIPRRPTTHPEIRRRALDGRDVERFAGEGVPVDAADGPVQHRSTDAGAEDQLGRVRAPVGGSLSDAETVADAGDGGEVLARKVSSIEYYEEGFWDGDWVRGLTASPGLSWKGPLVPVVLASVMKTFSPQ